VQIGDLDMLQIVHVSGKLAMSWFTLWFDRELNSIVVRREQDEQCGLNRREPLASGWMDERESKRDGHVVISGCFAGRGSVESVSNAEDENEEEDEDSSLLSFAFGICQSGEMDATPC